MNKLKVETVPGVVFGVLWRKIKKGANKVMHRDENAGKEVEDDVKVAEGE